LAYKIAHYFGLTIEEVFDLTEYLGWEEVIKWKITKKL
jgi:DNA-binding XRE family transcriptional regulator